MHIFKKTITFVCAIAVTGIGSLFVCPGAYAALPVVERTVANGSFTSFAIKNDNTLWAWGGNEGGQIGDGTTELRDQPALVLYDVISVYNSHYHTMAIKSDGSLWEWGEYDIERSIYPPPTPRFNTPSEILDNVVDMMDCGEAGIMTWGSKVFASIALKNDGSLWAWGQKGLAVFNSDGLVYENRVAPVMIMDNVASIGFGAVVKSDGTLWRWIKSADNDMGFTFEQVTNNMERIISSKLILKKDGSLWRWIDDAGNLSVEKLLDDVISASESTYVTVALRKDGGLYAWDDAMTGDTRIDFFTGEPIRTDHSKPRRVYDNVISFTDIMGGITATITDKSQITWGYYLPNRAFIIENNIERNRIKIIYYAEDGFYVRLSQSTPLEYSKELGYYHYDPVKNENVPVSVVNVNDVAFSTGSIFVMKNGSLRDGMRDHIIMDGVKVPAADVPSVPYLVANPTASTVLVNGKNVVFDAYLIDGNNYFKLRDLAYVLNGTAKQFEVGWDGAANAISLTSGKPYTAVGGEMTGKSDGAKTFAPTDSKILLDGGEVQFTAYNIEGNNYFKLRDIGAALNFSIEWDGERNTIVIDTNKGYSPE